MKKRAPFAGSALRSSLGGILPASFARRGAARALLLAAAPLALLATYACTYDYAAASHCNDGVKNADETGVDCGGSCGPCHGGTGAGGHGTGGHGTGGSCNRWGCGSCGACPSTCSNGKRDGDETDEDCGGSCGPCAFGLGCKNDGDCTSDATCDGDFCTPKNLSWRWTAVPVGQPSPPPRYGATMAFRSSDQSVVLFGGIRPSGELDDTWVLRDDVWSPELGSTRPSARHYAAMADDPQKGLVVLAGGIASSTLQDTLTNDGSWHTTGGAGGDRYGAVMVYDSTRHVLALFLGSDPTHLVRELDSGTFDWNNVTPGSTTLPDSRIYAATFYEPANTRFVLFGGEETGTMHPKLGDTWAYFPPTRGWKQLHPVKSPDPRDGAATSYDTDRGVAVLFGGATTSAPYPEDTWEFAADAWTENTATQLPAEMGPRRYHASMAYDAKHKRMVLFGGMVTSSKPLDGTFAYVGFGRACGDPAGCPGSCVDHVCCETSCDGGRCNTPAQPGICVTTPDGGP